MPCSNMPDGVSSMFSEHDTSRTPAAWSAMWMVDVAGSVAGQPVDFVDDQVVNGGSDTWVSIRCSSGRSELRADSPRSTNSSATSASNVSARRRQASLGGDGVVPPRPVQLGLLVDTRRYIRARGPIVGLIGCCRSAFAAATSKGRYTLNRW